MIGSVSHEERVVAALAIIDCVAVQPFDHLGDVIVLVRHEHQFTGVSSPRGLAFPTVNKRYREVGLERNPGNRVLTVSHVVHVGGMSRHDKHCLIQRTKCPWRHIFMKRNAVWCGASYYIVHQAVIVQVVHTTIRHAITIGIYTVELVAGGVHGHEWVTWDLTSDHRKLSNT